MLKPRPPYHPATNRTDRGVEVCAEPESPSVAACSWYVCWNVCLVCGMRGGAEAPSSRDIETERPTVVGEPDIAGMLGSGIIILTFLAVPQGLQRDIRNNQS